MVVGIKCCCHQAHGIPSSPLSADRADCVDAADQGSFPPTAYSFTLEMEALVTSSKPQIHTEFLPPLLNEVILFPQVPQKSSDFCHSQLPRGALDTHTPQPFCFYYILTICKVKEIKTVWYVWRDGSIGSVPCFTPCHME